MALSYGEELLARADARARRRAFRRRRRTLLLPAGIATVWALADTFAAQGARLDGGRQMIEHVGALAWMVVLVLIPLAVAIRPRGVPNGAALAVVAGPILSPLLFDGGWSLWQSAIVFAVAGAVLLGARARRSARR
jgi:hypothetical protein